MSVNPRVSLSTIKTCTYDKVGRLTALKDPVGNITTYTYDTYGRVATETRPDGGVTTYAYNTDNTIATITRRDDKVVETRPALQKHKRHLKEAQRALERCIDKKNEACKRGCN